MNVGPPKDFFSLKGLRRVPINELPILVKNIRIGHCRRGKTAIDVVLFLLKNDVEPQKISGSCRETLILDRQIHQHSSQ